MTELRTEAGDNGADSGSWMVMPASFGATATPRPSAANFGAGRWGQRVRAKQNKASLVSRLAFALELIIHHTDNSIVSVLWRNIFEAGETSVPCIQASYLPGPEGSDSKVQSHGNESLASGVEEKR